MNNARLSPAPARAVEVLGSDVVRFNRLLRLMRSALVDGGMATLVELRTHLVTDPTTGGSKFAHQFVAIPPIGFDYVDAQGLRLGSIVINTGKTPLVWESDLADLVREVNAHDLLATEPEPQEGS